MHSVQLLTSRDQFLWSKSVVGPVFQKHESECMRIIVETSRKGTRV